MTESRHRDHHARTTESESFEPKIPDLPPLAPIDWSVIGGEAPKLLDTPENWLPEADAVVITWASAEWAAMQHVFVASGESMAYADRFTDCFAAPPADAREPASPCTARSTTFLGSCGAKASRKS